ncbi:MAG: tetratricopeptide repeat protein [Candidatus Magasanikbacteria bacterium]|nr:tetratricopeptide repeat protein [Candidatus Magasanikbacteria bacterium]
MENKFTLVLNWITTVCLYLIVFLSPLFFLPVTSEKFELNKYFLFYFLTLLALLGFLGKMVIKKGFEIKRTPLDIPLLILWAFYLIVALFSQDKYLSFFGNFGSLGLSFVGFSLMLVFYFLMVQSFSSVKQILKLFYTILLSGFLSAVYFLVAASGLIKWTEFGLPQFNLFNSSNIVFGFFVSLIFILSLGFLAIKKKAVAQNILVLLVVLASLAVLLLLGFKSIWIVTAVGLFLLAIFFIGHLENSSPILNSLMLFFLVVSLLFVFLGEPKFLTKNLPLEVSLSPGLSWSIAYETLMTSPRNFIFGTGPGTFVYDFSQFRPDNMNLNFAWNVRFNQPYSSSFDWLATHGFIMSLIFLGVVSLIFGFLITIWVKYVLRLNSQKKFFGEEAETSGEYQLSPLFFWLISCGWLLMLISFFLVNFGIAQWIIFWTLLALMINASVYITKLNWSVLIISLKTTPQYALLTSFTFIVLFSALIVLGVYLGRFYTAEVFYAEGLTKNYDGRLQNFSQSLSYNTYQPQFYLGLADAFLGKAEEVASQGGTASVVSQYLASAVNSAKKATEIAPNNVATWEFLSNMYSNARSIAPEANSWVISALERATQLEKNNPLFYLSLGNAKLIEKRYSEAKDDFEKALSLKPDLLLGYVNLAALNEAQDNMNAAVSSLERGLAYGSNNAEYLVYLGRYYFNRAAKNDYGMAELAFKKAIILNPNYSDALYSLAYLYEKQGFKSQSMELYRRVLELNPNNKEIMQKVGEVSASEPVEISTSTLPVAPNKKK